MFRAIVSGFNIEVTRGFQGTIYQAELTGCREDVDYENRGIKLKSHLSHSSESRGVVLQAHEI